MSSVHKSDYRSYISDVKGLNFVFNIGSHINNQQALTPAVLVLVSV